uniref:Uncharacterized protein n=1 Tax=Heterorhabditis bacteriophora TaxID=37862 RepID=A0A1I7X5S6_HETBA
MSPSLMFENALTIRTPRFFKIFISMSTNGVSNRKNIPQYDNYIYSKQVQTLGSTTAFEEETVEDLVIIEKLKDFADKTTAHGARRILIAHNRFSATFWALFVLLFFCTFIYQATKLGIKYQKNEKITSISQHRILKS